MGRGRWYAVAVLGLLVVAGVLAWRTWRGASAGPFDPVAAVIALVGLAVSVASLRLAVRAQHQADTDTTDVARRLAIAVKQTESEAYRQLLGGHNRPINVQFGFRPAAGHEAAGSGRTGTLEKVVGYYGELRPQRMVITGVAGSGKTVLAVKLILGLLDGRARDAPVPVRMSAAQLDTSHSPSTAVQDWLVEHLTRAYQLQEDAARQVVAARMVLPVIDGLDEMDAIEEPGYASRAGQAIRACNAYLDGGQKASIVLTCRISQYEALEQAREWVHDAARVQLQPVRLPTARGFLAGRVTEEGRWRPVLDAMRRSGNTPLAQALSTPWRLTLAAAVYDQRDPATGRYLRNPADLTSADLCTEDKIRDHLLSLFIPAAVAVHGGPYSSSLAHRWLGVLACYLQANTPSDTRPARVIAGRTLSGTDLVLHEMWPLAGPRLPRAITSGPLVALLLGFVVSAVSFEIIRSSPRLITLSAFLTILLVGVIMYTWTAWPSPTVTSLQRLRSIHRRHELVLVLGGGLVAGFVAGPVVGLTVGLAVGLAGAHAVVLGLVAGVAGGLVAGLGLGSEVDPESYSARKPTEVVKANLRTGLVVGLVVGLVLGPAIGLVLVLLLGGGLVLGLGVGLVAGLAGGLMSGVGLGLSGVRYIALLLLTRRWSSHWLPWRLGSFLQWSYDAGLMRIADIGYQFRHRELQDYLARNPTA